VKFADGSGCPTDQEQREPRYGLPDIRPGLAFGTGTHHDHSLVLEWLASHELADKPVIDYGCGSGILPLPRYCWRNCAHAVDIDPQAITPR